MVSVLWVRVDSDCAVRITTRILQDQADVTLVSRLPRRTNRLLSLHLEVATEKDHQHCALMASVGVVV
jgi:hypothetical protein